jgi:hypothetical protein
MFRPHGVLVPAAGDYELELEADPELELSIIDLRRQRSRGHIVDWNNPITLEDVELPTLRGGEHARVQLREGTHLFVFSTRGYAPGSARVRATRIDTRPHFAAP